MGGLKTAFDAVIAWCYESPTLGLIRDGKYAIPLIQSLHLAGITIVLGTTVAFNLRLTDLGLTELPRKALVEQLWRWAKRGLVLTAVSGFFVFLPDPARYLQNDPFRLKMLLLALAILFQFTIFKRFLHTEHTRVARVLVAIVSLILWFGVGWSGRAIAFF